MIKLQLWFIEINKKKKIESVGRKLTLVNRVVEWEVSKNIPKNKRIDGNSCNSLRNTLKEDKGQYLENFSVGIKI